MSFYIKQDEISEEDTMVVYQVQEMSSDLLPKETSIGDVGFSLLKEIASRIGFKKITAYSHHTNPVRFLYPDDATVANALKMNFDEAIKRSPYNWDPIVHSSSGGNNGRIDGYELRL